MQRIGTPSLVGLVVALVLALAAPASADLGPGAPRGREAPPAPSTVETSAVKTEVQSSQVTDAQLQEALRALDGEVGAQLASAEAGRQAAQAARQAQAQAEAELGTAEAELAAVRDAVVARAVAAYKGSASGLVVAFLESRHPEEAARRHTVLAGVTRHDRRLLDRLRSTYRTLAQNRAAARDAGELAERREKEAQARVARLAQARADATAASGLLQARLKEYQGEADQMAAQEPALVQLLQARQGATGVVATATDQLAEARTARAAFGGGDEPATGVPVSLAWPVAGPVTSDFGLRWGRLHAGIDIGAATGTPIGAAKAGLVIFAGVMGGYGNAIILDHGGGFATLYGHQSRLEATLGQVVSQGQVLGYVGSTGHSTGPHLHLETRAGGIPRDPRPFLP